MIGSVDYRYEIARGSIPGHRNCFFRDILEDFLVMVRWLARTRAVGSECLNRDGKVTVRADS